MTIKFESSCCFACFALIGKHYLLVSKNVVEVSKNSHQNLWLHKSLTSGSATNQKKITFWYVSSQIHHISRRKSRKAHSSRKKTWRKREVFFATWALCEFCSRKTHVFATSVFTESNDASWTVLTKAWNCNNMLSVATHWTVWTQEVVL